MVPLARCLGSCGDCSSHLRALHARTHIHTHILTRTRTHTHTQDQLVLTHELLAAVDEGDILNVKKILKSPRLSINGVNKVRKLPVLHAPPRGLWCVCVCVFM